MLADHWRATFALKPGDTNYFDLFKPYVQKVPEGVCWELLEDDVKAMLNKLHNSAPGPDNIRYSAWKKISETATPFYMQLIVLYSMDRRLLRALTKG